MIQYICMYLCFGAHPCAAYKAIKTHIYFTICLETRRFTMSEKKITVAVAGCGSRGSAYADCCKLMSDKIEIVAAADIIPEKLNRYCDKYGVPENMRFASAEEMLKQDKLADVMFICTMDRQHYGHAIPALNKGYHLLLEKPASPDPKECREIADTANRLGLEVVVCHVLRYTPFYRKVKEIMDSGVLGQVLSIQANEQTMFWHQAHSFVRGNWRREEDTSPILLQKCCHDMDILLWLTGKHCKSVSSFGFLSHFKAENAPEGAPERCSEACPAYEECPYSIKCCYLNRADKGEFGWPLDVVEPEPDAAKLRETLKTSPYAQCVYHCDNDVSDHQVVNLLLDDELTISFNVCAFTSEGGRRIHVMGTKGDLTAYMEDNKIRLTVFGHESELIDSNAETDTFGHGGGDFVLVRELIDLLNGNTESTFALSSINDSIESHIVCLAAEQSSKNEGQLVKIADYVASL